MTNKGIETLNLTIDGQVEMTFVVKEKYNISYMVNCLKEMVEEFDGNNVHEKDSVNSLLFAIHMIENRGDALRVNPTPPPIMNYYKIDMIKAVREYGKTIGLSDDSCPPFGLKEAKDMVEYAIAANESGRARMHTRNVLGDF